MQGLEQLLAEREIYRKLVGFARAMDERDWGALESIARADMTADIGVGKLDSLQGVVSCIRSFLDDCGPTQHMLGNVLIEVAGDRASSRAYVTDMHLGLGDKSKLTFSTLGDYHDEWQKIDGEWWMTHRTKLNRAHIGDISVLGAGPKR